MPIHAVLNVQTTQQDERLSEMRHRRCHRTADALAAMTAGIAGLVLLGWAFRIPLLISVLPGLASMKVTTALGFLLCAASVLLANRRLGPSSNGWSKAVPAVSIISAAIAGLLGFGTLLGYGWPATAGQVTHPGWMAPATAVAFVLLGLSLMTSRSTRRSLERLSESAAFLVLLIGGAALIGYLYDEQALYRIGPYSSIALHTALLLVVLAVARFCIRPDGALMSVVVSRELGGVMIRRMLPLVVGMMTAIGWIRLAGERGGWFDSHFGLTVLVVLSMFGFGVILWQVGNLLNRTDATIRRSEERFRTLADNMSQFAWMIDDSGAAVWFNRRWYEYTGTDLTQMQGWGWTQVHHPDHVDRVVASWRRACRTGEPWEETFPLRSVDGAYRWFLTRAVPIRDAQGHINRWFGTNTDITDLRAAEAALLESEERLRSFAGQLEQLVAERTDELLQSQERLRALATELNLAEQRERKRLATDLHDHLAQMLVLCKLKLSQARHIPGLVPGCLALLEKTDNVLAQSLAYTRTLVADLAPPVLHDFGLPAALKWLGEQMRQHNLTVVVDVRDDELKLPEDRAVLLFQSVRELLMNASKHAGAGQATVSLDQRDDDQWIEVRDQGKGFDFTAAVAAAGNNTTTVMSSKFGLFSIRERMRALGGRFDLESAPGRGATATLILPLGGGAAASETRVTSETGGTGRGSAVAPLSLVSPVAQHARIRVLLVDDRAMVRQGLRSVLESYADVEVVGEAADGEEAVMMTERLNPALVLMDINMPKKSGIEATAEIKARRPWTVVIGLSVQANTEARDAMTKAGAAMLLTKEAAVDRLYQTIRQALKGIEGAKG